jgi:hypothetical protein
MTQACGSADGSSIATDITDFQCVSIKNDGMSRLEENSDDDKGSVLISALLEMVAKQNAEFQVKMKEKDGIIETLSSQLSSLVREREGGMPAISEQETDQQNDEEDIKRQVHLLADNAAKCDAQMSTVSSEVKRIDGSLINVTGRLLAIEASIAYKLSLAHGGACPCNASQTVFDVDNLPKWIIESDTNPMYAMIKSHKHSYAIIGRRLPASSSWTFPRYLNEGPGSGLIFPRDAADVMNMGDHCINSFWNWYTVRPFSDIHDQHNKKLQIIEWIEGRHSWRTHDMKLPFDGERQAVVRHE